MNSEFNNDEISRRVSKGDTKVAADGVMITTGKDTDPQGDLGRPRLLQERFAEHGCAHPLRAAFFSGMILSFFSRTGDLY